MVPSAFYFVLLASSFLPLGSYSFQFFSLPLSLFSLFSLRFLRMMKSSATQRVTKITGQPIENSFLTSSFFSRGDLIGGIVPRCTQEEISHCYSQHPTTFNICIDLIIRSNIYHSSKTECQRVSYSLPS